MDLSKFTPEYIQTTSPDVLRRERKQLIRHKVQCDAIVLQMTEHLVPLGEVEHAAKELAKMPPARRQAIAKALGLIGDVKVSGTGTVR